MELLAIKTPDKKNIYARLHGTFNKPVIIVVHGLGGSMGGALEYNSAQYFKKHDFSTLLVNLYDSRKGARKLHECTLKTHGKDIDAVVKYLKKRGVKKIFIAGHSYGAPSIMLSNHTEFKGIALWDGSNLPEISKELLKWKYIKQLNGRLTDGGTSELVGEAMIQESKSLETLDLIKKIKVPIKIIVAGEGPIKFKLKAVYAAANEPKSYFIVEGAEHDFSKEGAQEKVYSETAKWFKKFLKQSNVIK